jgi:hypothetical protein
MDNAQMDKMREYDYGVDEGSYLITAEEMTKRQMLTTIENWYANSCSLKFVNAVSTVDGDPNEGFEDLIPQGADWEEDEEDDYDDEEDEDENDY